MANGLAGTSYRSGTSELREILLLIEMHSNDSSDGWHRESARLFAIDIAQGHAPDSLGGSEGTLD